MTRDILMQVLSRSDGVKTDGPKFEVAEGHHVSFYVGQPGQAMVVSDVDGGTLDEGFLQIRTRESHSTFFLDYDAVHAIATRPPKEEEKRRAGFA